MSEEVPEECPLLDKCEQRVTKEEYETLCKTGTWIHCPQVPLSLVDKYKKRPREWKEEERNE